MLQYRVRYLFMFSFLVTFMLAGVEATFQLFQIEKFTLLRYKLVTCSCLVALSMQLFKAGRSTYKNGSETTWLIGAQIVTAIGMLLFTLTANLLSLGLPFVSLQQVMHLQELVLYHSPLKNLEDNTELLLGFPIQWIT